MAPFLVLTCLLVVLVTIGLGFVAIRNEKTYPAKITRLTAADPPVQPGSLSPLPLEMPHRRGM